MNPEQAAIARRRLGWRNQFERDVLARDSHICQVCEKPATTAHVITARRSMPVGGFVPSNGIALCRICHLIAKDSHRFGDQKYKPEVLYELIGSSFEMAMQEALEHSKRFDNPF